MKRFFLLVAAVVMAAGTVSAQDINEATTNYNSGATELQMENYASAISYFQTALEMGEAVGEAGTDLVANCKKAICSANLGMAKQLYNSKDFAAAAEAFGKTKEIAEGYGETEIAEEAAELTVQATKLQYNTEGTAALRAKNYPVAIESFKKVLEIEPDNGNAALQLGQAYMRANDLDASAEALELAKANGQEANADKLLSQVYLKKAQAASKAGKNQDAIDFCVKSNEYVESANAYKIAASASQKLNKNADVIKYYEKYLELSPNAKDAGGVAYTIAVIYQQDGNKAKAKEYYEKCANDPQFGAAAQEQLKTL